jgi:hypothetical protein
MFVLSASISTEDRNRLSFEFSERQTSQSQAIIGTPCDVPVPKKVIFKLPEYFVCDYLR